MSVLQKCFEPFEADVNYLKVPHTAKYSLLMFLNMCLWPVSEFPRNSKNLSLASCFKWFY